jgi:5'-nucleotidase
MRFYYHTDVSLMAGGTMRGDQIYPAGVIRLGHVISCFPFEDPCVVIRVPGSALWSALENSVSKLPALEGRFTQVSGLRFGYDPDGPEGNRVRWVEVDGEPMDPSKRYSIATRGYMARGKDGFESLNIANEDVETVIDEEHGVLISTIIRQYFLSLKVLSRWKRGLCVTKLFNGLKKDQVDAGVISRITSASLVSATTIAGTESPETSEDEAQIVNVEATSPVKERAMSQMEELRLFELKKRVARKWELLAKVGRNIRENGAAEVGVAWCRSVRPRVEGRINIVTS